MVKATLGAAAIAAWTLSAVALGTPTAAQTADQAAINAGKRLFNTEDCTKCHGAEGRGKRDRNMQLDGVSDRIDEATIRQWINDPETMTAQLETKPKVAMKPVDLTPAQVDSLVAYLMSLEPR